MEIRFHVTGTHRKELVGIISETIGMKAVYQFMPTCAFVIDNLTIDKEGTLIADERTDLDTVRKVLEAVEAAGFKAESIPEELLEQAPSAEEGPHEEVDGLVVSMPLEDFTEASLDNLRKLVDSKQNLIKKALGTEALPIEVYFDCFYHTSYKICPDRHYIHRNVVEEAVLADLQAVTAMVQEHEADFITQVKKKAHSCGKENLRKLQKEQTDSQKRLEDIDRIINQLYEDKVAGELSADRFNRMLGSYEEEQSKLRTRLEELHEIISTECEKTDGAEHFIRLVKQFSQITELTDEIVATFIEKVEVGVPEKVDGIKHQDITVFYNFIGTIEY